MPRCVSSSTGIIAVLSIYFLMSVCPAMAQVIFTDDRDQFLAENPGLEHQDFLNGNVPSPGVFNECSPPENARSNDACFSMGDILPFIEFNQDPFSFNGILLMGANVFGFAGNPPAVLTNNTYLASFEILFLPGVKTVGMDIGCARSDSLCTESVEVLVFGLNGLLGSTVITVTNNFDTFLGITSSERIIEIAITDTDTITPDVRGVLNVWFEPETNAIPTLSEWGMIAAAAGMGLVGVFFAVRRRAVKA